MRRWGVALIIVVVLSLIPIMALQTRAQGCMVMTQYGPAPDADCDGVIDQLDNCPSVANADQRDKNRNGIGDACDLLIQEITVAPDNHLRQGDIAHLVVRMVNNHNYPINDVLITARNANLGIDAQQRVASVPAGETAVVDFWLVLPKCATVGSYALNVGAQSSAGSAEVEQETIYIDKGTVCGTPSSALDSTVINVFNELTVDPGESAILPIKIANLGDSQATYELSANDLGGFGTWRIDPSDKLTLAGGQSDTAYLYLQTERYAQPGTTMLYVMITSNNKKTTIPVKVYVRGVKYAASPWAFLAQLFFIFALLLLILFAIFLAFRNRPKNGNENTTKEPVKSRKKVAVENADDKVETYY